MVAAAEPVVALHDLRFRWRRGLPVVLELEHLEIQPGERVFLRGPSGSGKTTLLGLIGGVLRAERGSIRIAGTELQALRAGRRDRLRADQVGFVFQLFNLIPWLSVLDNVMLPCRFSAQRRQRALARASTDASSGQRVSIAGEARRLLARLGLDDDRLLTRGVGQLSVGQQQRVAVARALLGSPPLVIADEPTSALDADARDAFLTLLTEECSRSGAALLFVSHDTALAPHFQRQLDMQTLNRAVATALAATEADA